MEADARGRGSLVKLGDGVRRLRGVGKPGRAVWEYSRLKYVPVWSSTSGILMQQVRQGSTTFELRARERSRTRWRGLLRGRSASLLSVAGQGNRWVGTVMGASPVNDTLLGRVAR